MDLYIVRHAWAVERDDPRWPDDDDRPLSEVGRTRFTQMVTRLADLGVKPRIVATSPLVRCIETAQILAAGVGKAKVAPVDDLRPGSNLDGLLRWTVRQVREHETVAWVGHAPDVNRLAAAVIGDAGASIHFAKGSVAAIRFDGPPSVGQGDLQWLVTAKLLGC